MTFREVLRYVKIDEVKLELWDANDQGKHKQFYSWEESFEKYMDYEIALITPILTHINNWEQNEIVVNPVIKICIELFD